MSAAELYNRAINFPDQRGLVIALGVAVAVMAIAGVLLSLGKFRWFARGLGIVACLMVMAVLWIVQFQAVTFQSNETIRSTRPRYAPRTRALARSGLIALPAAAVLVMVSVWTANRRWLRSQVPRHLKAGRKHFYKKEYDAALAEYNQAIESSPHLAEAYARRGCVYQAMGDTARALADFDQAIQRDPRLAKAYLERGKIRTESGDLEGALEDFWRLLTIRADDPELYLNRGVCFLKKGLVNEAISDFQRVLKLTNHSDFAEPAKNYLRQLEKATFPSPMPFPGPNGPAAPPASPQPRASDHVL
jgi:tetratricopeptide (TPR) repeat protein